MPGEWWRAQVGDGEYEIVGYQYPDGTRVEWPGSGNISEGRLMEMLQTGAAASLIVEIWPEGDREASVTRTIHYLPGGWDMKTILRGIQVAAARYGINLEGLEDDDEILESAGE